MNRIAAVTVIRGEGECEAFVNGIANKEIEKIKMELEMVTNELKYNKENRNNARKARIKALREEEVKPISLFEKIRNAIVNGWSIFWAITHEWGFWEWDGEEK